MYQYIRGIPEKEYREEPVEETAKEKEKTPLGFEKTLGDAIDEIGQIADTFFSKIDAMFPEGDPIKMKPLKTK